MLVENVFPDVFCLEKLNYFVAPFAWMQLQKETTMNIDFF